MIRFIHHENTNILLHFTVPPKVLWPVKKKENQRVTYSEKKNKQLK